MDDLQFHFSQLNEIINAVERLNEEFFEEVDLNLLQKELTVFLITINFFLYLSFFYIL